MILGASADPVKAQQSFKAKRNLNYPLLSDPDHKMLEAYGVWRMKRFMGRSFKGIVRTTVLIGAAGKVEAVWNEVKAKGHAAETLARVRELTA